MKYKLINSFITIDYPNELEMQDKYLTSMKWLCDNDEIVGFCNW